MTQKLIIIGDTHGNYEVIEKIFQKENALGEVIAILHAGDIGVYDENSIGVLDEVTGKYTGRLTEREIKLIIRHNNPVGEFLPYIKGEKKFPVPFYNIAGNHEDFDLYDELLDGKVKVENFIPLHPSKVYEIEFGKQRLKIAGLGKIFPRPGSDKIGPLHIRDKDFDLIKRTLSKGVDIFLLHEPIYLSRQKENQGWMSFGSPRITELIRESHPSKVFIGHMHFEYFNILGNSNIYGLGYGVVGRYAVMHSDFSVEFKSVKDDPIKLTEVKMGIEANYLLQVNQAVEMQKIKKEVIAQKERKKIPYDLNWLKGVTSIKVETKEEQKKYKKLFSEISRLYNSEKSEDEIIQFVNVWMGGLA